MSFQQYIDSAIKEKEIFFIGEKLPSDWYEGFILWEKIAQTGDPKALFNIAYCYFTGEGTSKDINIMKNQPKMVFLMLIIISIIS